MIDTKDRQALAKYAVVCVVFTVSVLLVAIVLGLAVRMFLVVAFA